MVRRFVEQSTEGLRDAILACEEERDYYRHTDHLRVWASREGIRQAQRKFFQLEVCFHVATRGIARGLRKPLAGAVVLRRWHEHCARLMVL